MMFLTNPDGSYVCAAAAFYAAICEAHALEDGDALTEVAFWDEAGRTAHHWRAVRERHIGSQHPNKGLSSEKIREESIRRVINSFDLYLKRGGFVDMATALEEGKAIG